MNAQGQTVLFISDKVERLMEDRHILREDVQRTIERAEATGEKFIDPSSGRSLACFRPERVTFWVEYSRDQEVYRVHSTYSHRMEMKRGKGL